MNNGYLLCFLGLAILVCCRHVSSQSDKFRVFASNLDRSADLVVLDASIVDGSGQPSYEADLIVVGDSIAFMGEIDTSLLEINQLIDAKGKVLAPGFIDPHAHGDPLGDHTFENFLAMGVTTIILGQDGSSPVHDRDQSVSAYFDNVRAKPHLLNLGFLAGHGSIRRIVGATTPGPISDTQLVQMKEVLQEALQAGCLGMSTGLEYLPGNYARDRELLPLAQVVGAYEGLIMSHVRSEDQNLVNEALDELLRQGAHCPVHVSHIKVVYGKGPEEALRIRDKLSDARSKGVEVTADVYPYMASYTGIGIVFPSWAKTRSDFEKALATRPDQLREFLTSKVNSRNGPEATLFGTGPFAGKTLAAVAQASGRHFADVLIQLGPIGASGAYFVMNESLQEQFIADSMIMICTDGSPTMRHPRGYGAFAKVIRKYVMEQNLLSLEEAVRQMTALPAQTLGLDRRGRIQVGYKADFSIFDPANVQDHASFEDPFRLAEGFDHVVINGHPVWADQAITDRRPGSLLLR